MNAVVKPNWQRLRTELTEMVKRDGYPLDYIRFTEEETVRWIDEEGRKPDSVAYYMLDAMSELTIKQFEKADELLTKMMLGTMTVDEATQWRDMQKNALKEFASAWARRVIEEEMEL
jgi:hypothetical protein